MSHCYHSTQKFNQKKPVLKSDETPGDQPDVSPNVQPDAPAPDPDSKPKTLTSSIFSAFDENTDIKYGRYPFSCPRKCPAKFDVEWTKEGFIWPSLVKKTIDSMFCPKHPSKELEMFCITCMKPLCLVCPHTQKCSGLAHSPMSLPDATHVLDSTLSSKVQALTSKIETMDSTCTTIQDIILLNNDVMHQECGGAMQPLLSLYQSLGEFIEQLKSTPPSQFADSKMKQLASKREEILAMREKYVSNLTSLKDLADLCSKVKSQAEDMIFTAIETPEQARLFSEVSELLDGTKALPEPLIPQDSDLKDMQLQTLEVDGMKKTIMSGLETVLSTWLKTHRPHVGFSLVQTVGHESTKRVDESRRLDELSRAVDDLLTNRYYTLGKQQRDELLRVIEDYRQDPTNESKYSSCKSLLKQLSSGPHPSWT